MAFVLAHRILVQPETLESVRSHCEATEDFVWVGAKRAARPQRLRRYTLRGVPAKRIDLALIDGPWDGQSHVVAEIGTKSGRFDGACRTQIVLRHWYDQTPANLPPVGWLRINRDEEPGQIVLAAMWQGGDWIECHRALKSDLVAYDLHRLVLWHWTRYYRFLPREDAEAAALAFEGLHPSVRYGTLAEANRLASRYLYHLARDLGWCKLTAREQAKRGVSGQWHRTEEVYGTVQGVGEYTLDAANGRRPMRESREMSREDYLDLVADRLDAPVVE